MAVDCDLSLEMRVTEGDAASVQIEAFVGSAVECVAEDRSVQSVAVGGMYA